MSAKRLLGLAIVSLWLVAGCSSAKKIDVGGTCVLNSDCNSPLLCTDSKCHDACHASIDCPAGENCVKTASSTVCQLPAEASCARTPCSSAYVCASDLQCRAPCQSAADCADAQVCVTNACADPIELVPPPASSRKRVPAWPRTAARIPGQRPRVELVAEAAWVARAALRAALLTPRPRAMVAPTMPRARWAALAVLPAALLMQRPRVVAQGDLLEPEAPRTATPDLTQAAHFPMRPP